MAAASSADESGGETGIADVLDDLLEMVETLYELLANHKTQLEIFQEENRNLRMALHLPQMMTSPPTPLSVDTCVKQVERVRLVLDPKNPTVILSGAGLTALTDL